MDNKVHKFDMGVLSISEYVDFRRELIEFTMYKEDFEVVIEGQRLSILFTEALSKSRKFKKILNKFYRPFRFGISEDERYDENCGLDKLMRD
jgi:hypothetical protein